MVGRREYLSFIRLRLTPCRPLASIAKSNFLFALPFTNCPWQLPNGRSFTSIPYSGHNKNKKPPVGWLFIFMVEVVKASELNVFINTKLKVITDYYKDLYFSLN